jgi:hypothetical protein
MISRRAFNLSALAAAAGLLLPKPSRGSEPATQGPYRPPRIAITGCPLLVVPRVLAGQQPGKSTTLHKLVAPRGLSLSRVADGVRIVAPHLRGMPGVWMLFAAAMEAGVGPTLYDGGDVFVPAGRDMAWNWWSREETYGFTPQIAVQAGFLVRSPSPELLALFDGPRELAW